MIKIKWALYIVISSLLLTGCAGTKSSPVKASSYDGLYNGQSTALFSTLFPATSAAEAKLRGDQALIHAETDKALFFYVQALELDDQDAQLFHKMARIYLSRNQLKMAKLASIFAIKNDPKHALSLEVLGYISFMDNDLNGARQYLSKALSVNKDAWNASNLLGIIADLEARHDLARSFYSDALKGNPSSTKVLNNLGYSYYLSNNLLEAEKTINQVLSLDKENYTAQQNLALIYFRQNKPDQSLSMLQNIMPSEQASNFLGYLYLLKLELADDFDQQDYNLARQLFESAIAQSPRYLASSHQNLERLQRRVY